MRLGAQPFLGKWVLFAWEWKIISMKAEHLTSLWYIGPGELGNGLFSVNHVWHAGWKLYSFLGDCLFIFNLRTKEVKKGIVNYGEIAQKSQFFKSSKPYLLERAPEKCRIWEKETSHCYSNRCGGADEKAFCRRSDSRHKEPQKWVPEVLLLVCGGMLRSRPQADGSWANEKSLAHRVLMCYRKYIGVTKILSSIK